MAKKKKTNNTEQAKAEEAKAEETKAEETKPEETKAEETKPKSKTVTVDREVLETVHAAVCQKCNADKKRRGMSQPNTTDRALIEAGEVIGEILN